MVKVENVVRYFLDATGKYTVLKGISLEIKKGEIVALTGASGSGKTTFLQILGGLDKPNEGTVAINDIELQSMNDRQLAKFRGDCIGFVFQFHHLLPDFTALENTIMPGLIIGKPRAECIDRAKDLLATVGLSRQITHFPSQLSGGERQRVALARALFNDPALVLADEPTGNLDKENGNRLLELFRKMNKELGQTFLIATHNRQISDAVNRNLFIDDGYITEEPVKPKG